MKRTALVVASLTAFASLVLFVLARLERPPSGPEEPAWDRQTCAYCRMHLGERGFAAELQLETGEVLFFDDPGCLYHWRAESPGRAGRAWYHHLTEERWLSEEEVGFVAVDASPMGWGYGARGRGEPGTISADAAFGVGRAPGGADAHP